MSKKYIDLPYTDNGLRPETERKKRVESSQKVGEYYREISLKYPEYLRGEFKPGPKPHREV
jgi:hypothetical protein